MVDSEVLTLSGRYAVLLWFLNGALPGCWCFILCKLLVLGMAAAGRMGGRVLGNFVASCAEEHLYKSTLAIATRGDKWELVLVVAYQCIGGGELF